MVLDDFYVVASQQDGVDAIENVDDQGGDEVNLSPSVTTKLEK